MDPGAGQGTSCFEESGGHRKCRTKDGMQARERVPVSGLMH